MNQRTDDDNVNLVLEFAAPVVNSGRKNYQVKCLVCGAIYAPPVEMEETAVPAAMSAFAAEHLHND